MIRNALNKSIMEKGQALILVLILLLLVSLVITPLLTLMSTGLKTSQVFEELTYELYAADAGVEYALWCISNNATANSSITVGGIQVNITVKDEYSLDGLIVTGEGGHADWLELSSQIVPNGDNVTFTHTCNIAVKNVSNSTVMIKTVGFGLPGGFTYVNGSSFWNGVSIGNPDVDGNKLSWDIESLGDARKLVSEATKTLTFRMWGTGTPDGYYSWVVAKESDIGTVSSCTAYKITAQTGGTTIEAYIVKNEGSVSPASWKIN